MKFCLEGGHPVQTNCFAELQSESSRLTAARRKGVLEIKSIPILGPWLGNHVLHPPFKWTEVVASDTFLTRFANGSGRGWLQELAILLNWLDGITTGDRFADIYVL